MKWHGRDIPLLRHHYNCQINDPVYPPPGGKLGKWLLDWHHRRHGVPVGEMRSSERAVEIPLAIDFLANSVNGGEVLEIGCVLPYYILKPANHRVYDLMDAHPENVRRDVRTLAEAELSTNVLSVSTLEHIGLSDYGIASSNPAANDAVNLLQRILANAKRCFITFPLGHNPCLDAFVQNSSDLGETYLTRDAANPEQWRPVGKSALTEDMRRENGYCRANTLCIVERTAD